MPIAAPPTAGFGGPLRQGIKTKTVTREDLYEAVRRGAGLSRSDAASLVAQVLEEITACLGRGETVKFSSFGSFIVRQKGERIGRNPRTGKPAPISARRILVFKPSRILKRRVSSPAAGASEAGQDAIESE
jgi:integration host factor subunit alpha